LCLLLHAKAYLKRLYDIKDSKVVAYDPLAAAAAVGSSRASAAATGGVAGAGSDRPIVPDREAIENEWSEFPEPPDGLAEALLKAHNPLADAPIDDAGSSSSAASIDSRYEAPLLTHEHLAGVAAKLTELMETLTGDFSTSLPALSVAAQRAATRTPRQAKTRATAASKAGKGTGKSKGSRGGTGKAKRKGKRKAWEESDDEGDDGLLVLDDDDDDADDFGGGEEDMPAPPRKRASTGRGRARKASSIVDVSAVEDSEAEGDD
jgi:hypothetical protein